MTVNSVKIKNFRNIADLSFTADNGVNVIYGENAQGKTNIFFFIQSAPICFTQL